MNRPKVFQKFLDIDKTYQIKKKIQTQKENILFKMIITRGGKRTIAQGKENYCNRKDKHLEIQQKIFSDVDTDKRSGKTEDGDMG